METKRRKWDQIKGRNAAQRARAHSHWWDCRPLQSERKKKRRREVGRKSKSEGAATRRCFPSASLSFSRSLTTIVARRRRRTRWNSLDGRKKRLTSQIMPTEHGNAFRFEERLGGHLASLALSLGRRASVLSFCLSVDRVSPKRNGKEKKRREGRGREGEANQETFAGKRKTTTTEQSRVRKRATC